MLNLNITLDPSWVIRNRNEKEMPMDLLVPMLTDNFALKVKSRGMTRLNGEIEVPESENEDSLKKAIIDLLSEHFVDAEDHCHIMLTESTEDNDDTADNSNGVYREDPMAANGNADPHYEIMGLVGVPEFKKLAEECERLAPAMSNLSAENAFFDRSYLFSVNEGCGLSNMLLLFSELLDHLHMIPPRKASYPRKREIRLPPLGKDSPLPSRIVYDLMDKIPDPDGVILCFDIAAWMNSINTVEFHDFIKALKNYAFKTVVVLRIPFVEENVLKKITAELNQQLFIKGVPIAPYSNEQLGTISKKVLSDKGFEISDDALKVVRDRLAEECTRGKNYGIRTVERIASEAVFKKMLSDPCDNVIRAGDLDNFVGDDIFGGKTGRELLDELIGIENVRDKLYEMIASIEAAAKIKNADKPCIHMRFVGKPGTGKTTVARILGKILKERGVLSEGNFFEHSGRDLCGMYIGQTAPKTAAACHDAYGSVLFIDEAYSLYVEADDTKDFGREAITTLIAEMENHRTDMVVIMAGYTDDMEDMLKSNSGLRDRMPYKIEFPDYTREQLAQIFLKMASKNYSFGEDFEDAVKKFFDSMTDDYMESKDFSNARFARNLFERTVGKAALRCSMTDTELLELTTWDFSLASADGEFTAAVESKKRSMGFIS